MLAISIARLTDVHGSRISMNTVSATAFKAIAAPTREGARSEEETEKGLRVSDKGFLNTAVIQSSITYIDGEKGILRYRCGDPGIDPPQRGMIWFTNTIEGIPSSNSPKNHHTSKRHIFSSMVHCLASRSLHCLNLRCSIIARCMPMQRPSFGPSGMWR